MGKIEMPTLQKILIFLILCLTLNIVNANDQVFKCTGYALSDARFELTIRSIKMFPYNYHFTGDFLVQLEKVRKNNQRTLLFHKKLFLNSLEKQVHSQKMFFSETELEQKKNRPQLAFATFEWSPFNQKCSWLIRSNLTDLQRYQIRLGKIEDHQ